MSTPCESCNDIGWILASTSIDHDEIQRCDMCERFKGDREAWQGVIDAINKSIKTTIKAKDTIRRRHLNGLLHVVQQFEPLKRK